MITNCIIILRNVSDNQEWPGDFALIVLTARKAQFFYVKLSMYGYNKQQISGHFLNSRKSGNE